MTQDPIELARHLLAHKKATWDDFEVATSLQRVIKTLIPGTTFEARTINTGENGEALISVYLEVNGQFLGLHGERCPGEVGRAPFLSRTPGSLIANSQAPERRQMIEDLFMSIAEQVQLHENTLPAAAKDRLGPRL